jgi:hypothetical protein
VKPSETTALMSRLKASYPRQPISDETIRAYAEALADLDAERVARAVAVHIRTSPYFPAISEICQACAEDVCAAPTAADAWDEVMRAVSRYGQYRLPEWSHPVIGKCVDGIGGWIGLCQSENSVADRSQFMRLYADERPRAVKAANVGPMLEAQASRSLKPQSVGEILKALPGGKP